MAYKGRNIIKINAATMNALVEEWLHKNHGGGPYTVESVEETTKTANYGREYEIAFVENPPPSDQTT